MYGFSALEIQSSTENHKFRRDAEKYGFRLYDCRDTGMHGFRGYRETGILGYMDI